MGAALKTRSKVSMVAILDYSGAEKLHCEAQRLAKLQKQKLLSENNVAGEALSHRETHRPSILLRLGSNLC